MATTVRQLSRAARDPWLWLATGVVVFLPGTLFVMADPFGWILG